MPDQEKLDKVLEALEKLDERLDKLEGAGKSDVPAPRQTIMVAGMPLKDLLKLIGILLAIMLAAQAGGPTLVKLVAMLIGM